MTQNQESQKVILVSGKWIQSCSTKIFHMNFYVGLLDEKKENKRNLELCNFV